MRFFGTIIPKRQLIRMATPNPNCVRFQMDDHEPILADSFRNSIEVRKADPPREWSGVTQPIFDKHMGVRSLMLGKDFVSACWDKAPDDAEQEDLGASLQELILQGDLQKAWLECFETLETPEETASDQVEEEILRVIDEKVRPNLQLDGGDVEYRGFENGIVKLRLVGACIGCPSSTATLRFSIKNLLTFLIDEVEDVEQVWDDADVEVSENWTG